jgi:transcription initiation factor TFIIE subunit alpha
MESSDLSFARANFLVERLVKLIARAFYSDTYIIVLDALLREKYIRYEEIGPRLKLGEKDVNAIVTRLENDMLIRFEDMQMDEGEGKFRMAKCYYINYQQFVNVVRFRVRRMQEAVASAEKTELDEVFYQCPTCQHRSDKYDDCTSPSLWKHYTNESSVYTGIAL